MADINGFKASLINGGVRNNQFRVELTFPQFVSDGIAAAQLGQFHCRAASLPSSTVAPIDIYYQGRAIKVAGERQFDNWEIQVYNEDFKVRDALMRWSHGINNITNNTGVIQPSIYQRDLLVKQLDRNGKVLKTVKIVDAMPIQVGGIQLDFEANNQIEQFSVVFTYNWFEESGVTATEVK